MQATPACRPDSALASVELLACRDKVGELVSQVCSGVGQEETAAALQGLLAAAAHVRAAAITAMLDVPAFAEGAHPLQFVCSASSPAHATLYSLACSITMPACSV